MNAVRIILVLCGVMLAMSVSAQQSERFDQYELHYSVVYTTFLSPETAAEYNITRGRKKAMLTLSVRDAEAGETAGRPMLIKGKTWDLIHSIELDFQVIQEGSATYYIAPFEFIDREWRFFKFDFRPEGSNKTYQFDFKNQLWLQDEDR